MPIMRALFLVGEQRSGSNLLRLMISSSHAIAAPHPPHILQRIDPIVPVGEVVDEKRFERLVETVCRLVETNPVPWLHTRLDRADVERRCKKRHVVAIFGAVMDIYAEANGAHAWMCKSMQNICWAKDLDAYFEDSSYVYLHRDPRDVALSFTKAVVGEKHVYFIARQWAALQRRCLDARRHTRTNRFFTVSYAALTQETESTLRNLCAAIGIEFSADMLRFYDSEEARNTAEASSLWANVARPLMHHNVAKFMTELSAEQIRTIELVAGSELDELGYVRVHTAPGETGEFTPELIGQFREENERLKRVQAEKTGRTDPADAERRERQAHVLAELKSAARAWSMMPV
jgi:hypothetical protein